MSSAYDKLQRILVLEKKQDCRNRAVFGGLNRFLVYWQKEAQQEAGEHRLSVGQIMALFDDYEAMSQEERAQTVTYVLGVLAEEAEAQATAQASPGPEAQGPKVVQPSEQEESLAEPAEETLADTSVEDSWHPATGGTGEQAEARVARRRGRPPAPPRAGETLSSPVGTLKGVGEVNAQRLKRLGIETIRDLIYHFPRRYDDFSALKKIQELQVGEEVTIVGVIQSVESFRTRNGTHVTRAVVHDGTAPIEVSWFNQPFLEKRLRPGREVVISGTVEQYLGRLVFNAPEWEPLQRQLLHTGRLVPVYPLTKGMRPRWLRRLMKRTLDTWVPRIIDPIPEEVLRSAKLFDLGMALRQVHFPSSYGALERARQRLAFDEFFLLQLGILAHRRIWRSQRGRALEIPWEAIREFVQGLPYMLTEAQDRAIREILEDMSRPEPMSRLLQGDVGSGKTVVAVAAMLAAVRNGLQAAIMAPTSILAEQHYRTVSELLARYPDIRCALLVGNLSEQEKARVQEAASAGRAHVVVGTHALIQDSVDFHRLGLVVVDEQHRFGVAQRAALRAKGGTARPHLLTMSATPIPRTLALTIYGDLDISVLDELPPGRQQVLTAVRDYRSRERIYAFIDGQIEQGRQAFIICPLVEESEVIDAKSATQEFERLQKEVFAHRRLGLLHGRMSDDDKERVMAAFKGGEIDILVSTPVVEVGIDVPNATVMLIEGADRFGLAQLHQFRGRVGRGAFKSYCILLADDPSPAAMERLSVLEQTTDGFMLAEKDLEMRGAGEFFGLRQHGLPELKVANLGDTETLEMARKEALALFNVDPDLSRPEHRLLGMAVRRFWSLPDLS
ncbi:MAG: ATP-dependent DNA helicase RecG [Chloroflexi bacterium]|nr:ATP-dependent DNA helicase RecG [Chloroflexota bacterium]